MAVKKCRVFAAAAVVVGSIGVCRGEAAVPIPAATLIPGTTLCVVDGWEYAGRWSTPNNGIVEPSLESCAMACEADPVCTGATFIVEGSTKNCWFKDWGMGPAANPCLPNPDSNLVFQAIIDPNGADCGAITYMNEPVYNCDVEMEIDEKPEALAPVAEGPMAAVTVTDPADLLALNPPFAATVGVDYSALQEPPPAQGIEDIGDGFVVADAVACATACAAEVTCNAASYYGDNPSELWPAGANCWLKTLTGCTLPPDMVMTGDSTYFLIGGAECAGALPPVTAGPLADTPITVIAPIAGAPIAPTATAPVGFPPSPAPKLGSAPTEADPVGTDTSNRTFAPTEPPTNNEAGSAGVTPVPPSPPSGSMPSLPGLAATVFALVGTLLLL